ncbi:CPBP family intramembrane glutamic endopeptidase [Porphyrobacter sp. ULC335]|uniref:CPBP family intramembrane glutamic endopeptidase n=1 Tax=Porphyrobacter sp. ULC335 TaxID=2854260 RepID=UPI002220C2CF|nr:type II CAAX endopeptidase family protein [Porphyrobacter sp. ULC335]UYV16700.1 CPBP family intramembrane metalloprotease [Porphyrobacter sp. ULC335]
MKFTSRDAMVPDDWQSPDRPSWAGIGIGLASYSICLVLVALAMGYWARDVPVWQGVIGSYAGAIAGLCGFAAACLVRRTPANKLGLVATHWPWYAVAVGLAIATYGLSLSIIDAHMQVTGRPDESQAVLHAAVRGGALPFLLALVGGAILTPLGEELLFRGIIANALNRYGAWAGIAASALIFGMAHGTGAILWVAIMAGLVSGLLFRRTGSVWPSVLLHMAYNGLHSFASALS